MKKTQAQLDASALWRERNREASRLRVAKWRAENPDKHRAMQVDWQQRNPEKHAARKAVRQALYDGKLIRQPCWICGNPNTDAHHASYAPDMRLHVTWLCRLHHREIHKRAIANPARPVVKLTEEVMSRAIALRNQGLQWKAVGAAVGMSEGQLIVRLKEHPDVLPRSRWGLRR